MMTLCDHDLLIVVHDSGRGDWLVVLAQSCDEIVRGDGKNSSIISRITLGIKPLMVPRISERFFRRKWKNNWALERKVMTSSRKVSLVRRTQRPKKQRKNLKEGMLIFYVDVRMECFVGG